MFYFKFIFVPSHCGFHLKVPSLNLGGSKALPAEISSGLCPQTFLSARFNNAFTQQNQPSNGETVASTGVGFYYLHHTPSPGGGSKVMTFFFFFRLKDMLFNVRLF